MTNRFILLPVLTAAFAAAALAAPMSDKNACFERAFALAERASKAKLEPSAAAKVEAHLKALESACTSASFAKAEEAAAAAEKAIEGK